METNYELKSVDSAISEFDGENIKSFVLSFSDGNSTKDITLCGFGDLKETIKV